MKILTNFKTAARNFLYREPQVDIKINVSETGLDVTQRTVKSELVVESRLGEKRRDFAYTIR